MIREIELINFKSHKKTKLKFTEGNNIFVGISGSGKSTILDAICFGFFGTTPKIQKKRIKISDLIMDKPFKEESANVKIIFESDKKNYEINRSIYLNKSSYAELRENGKLIAINQAQVTEAIEKILKVDYELFSKVIYAEQNKLDYFLTLPPGNRMSDIDNLLKLSKFELARAKTTSLLNKFKNQKNMREETLSNFDERDLKEKRREIEEYLEKLNKDLSSLEENTRKLNNQLEEKEKILEDLKEQKNKMENKKNMLIELNATISVFQNELKKLPEKDLGEIEKKLKHEETLYNNLEKEKIKREKEMSFLISKINELEKALAEKKEGELFLQTFDEERIRILKKEAEDLKNTLVTCELKKQNLDEAIKNLKTSKERCPTCDRELPEEKRKELIKKKEEKLFLLNKKIIDLKNKYSSKKREFELENKNIEKANFFKKRIEQLGNVEGELSLYQKKLEEIKCKEIDLSDIKKEVMNLKTLFEELKSAEIKKQRLKDLKREKENIERELREISFDESVYENLKKEVEEIKKNLLTFRLDLKYKEEIKTEKQNNLKQIKRDLEFLQINKKEILYLDYAISVLSDFSSILIEVQEILREEFVKTLNEVMNELWNYIYPYEDYIGIRFKIENRDYLLQLCDLKNRWINVEGFSSGGERSIASLVMRIALSIVLAPNLKLLALDEPTHNLDSNTIKNLTEILRTKIAELLDQIFIVTHDERLIQAGTAYIYKFRRESSKKEPTKVREIII